MQRRAGILLDQCPTIVLIGAPWLGLAEPGNILLASLGASAVLLLWLRSRWPMAPVAAGLNLHLAVVPWLFALQGALGAEALQDRIAPFLLPSVTAAGVAALILWSRGRSGMGADDRAALCLLGLAAILWALMHADERVLAVGLPALALSAISGIVSRRAA